MTPGCDDCVAAGQRAKAAGHREWRTGFACYECAAFDLDSPEGRLLMAGASEATEDQPDMFAA